MRGKEEALGTVPATTISCTYGIMNDIMGICSYYL